MRCINKAVLSSPVNALIQEICSLLHEPGDLRFPEHSSVVCPSLGSACAAVARACTRVCSAGPAEADVPAECPRSKYVKILQALTFEPPLF